MALPAQLSFGVALRNSSAIRASSASISSAYAVSYPADRSSACRTGCCVPGPAGTNRAYSAPQDSRPRTTSQVLPSSSTNLRTGTPPARPLVGPTAAAGLIAPPAEEYPHEPDVDRSAGRGDPPDRGVPAAARRGARDPARRLRHREDDRARRAKGAAQDRLRPLDARGRRDRGAGARRHDAGPLDRARQAGLLDRDAVGDP